jgi:phage tail sheath protein
MVSKLPIDQSSTGQTIELPSIDYQLTNSQLARLTTAGVVTFKKSFTKGIVVTDGITMAPSESVFRRLSTTRIVGAVEELIRAAAEPFIGKENHAANRNALNTELKAALDKIKGTLIEQYEFKMNLDVSIQKLSYIEVTYQIVPIYEIREVRNTIKMLDTISASSAVG